MATATEGHSIQFRQVAGIVLAVALIALLVFGLDTGAIVDTLASADPALVVLAVATSLAAQLCWSLTTATLLAGTNDSLPRHRVQLGYLSGTFGKQILPLGNVGGTAILAYVISEDLGQRFRDVFAAVTASELVIFAGSLGVAALGLFELVLWPRPGFDGPVVLGGSVAILAVLVVGSALVAYRRGAVGTLVVATAAGVHWALSPFSERVARLVEPARVGTAVESFLTGFEAATADRRRVAVAALFGVAGWLAFGLALYYGLVAVDISLPLGLALFLAPASGVATLLPTPGGLGSSEVGLTAVFTLLTGASLEQAAAGVLLYRLATYWLILTIGGLASVYLSASVWHALE
ncbi:lysylphosphatidylglycerol synthase transmembrane domain-containing protein [Haloarcula halophila]|uniref:lysylphosphatidylglycerol synthase transmembrane domain-containing protein n=1 Tax=Haloarcula TaxID=2237 RepID=UPI0023E3D5CD|nr:lysylphosphatidylglycerol synthase transmembrane domain-containing protein [Halomicroarcula sp. DFY41]